MDIYFPKDRAIEKDVFVFIHGGSWRSGKKNTYRLFARKMARRGFVTILINYRLAPEVRYDKMAEDCARALAWSNENVGKYGGDSTRITVAGHSAGGHLAAYITISDAFEKLHLENPISKTILIDAFGLDMHKYFKDYKNDYAGSLAKVFTNDPEEWKRASPFYYIDTHIAVPFLIVTGSKTYPAIIESSKQFYTSMKNHGGVCEYHRMKRKKHIGMITQLLFPQNKLYKIMDGFIRAPRVN